MSALAIFPDDAGERTFGQETRRRREARGWTQQQLADAARLSRAAVQDAEAGRTLDPETALRLACAFGGTAVERWAYLQSAGALPPTSFGGLLLAYRSRAGLNQSGLARRAGLNSSTLARFETGERDHPTRSTVEAVCRALALSPADTDALHGAAGYLPPSLEALGPDDPTLLAVRAVLGDDTIPAPALASFRAAVQVICSAPWVGRAR